jgi:hypothetical protein
MFKALVNKITAVFAQPKVGEVVPVQEKVEKVEAVMKAPIVEIVPELTVQPKKKAPAKKAPTKKTAKPAAKKTKKTTKTA